MLNQVFGNNIIPMLVFLNTRNDLLEDGSCEDDERSGQHVITKTEGKVTHS